MLVFLALGDAKVLSFALGDAKVPDARYFAFWWNIGLTLFILTNANIQFFTFIFLIKLVSHQTIYQDKKNRPTFTDEKIGRFYHRFYFIVFLVRIGDNPPIWVSHSPTIKDCKKLFLRDLNTKKQCNIMITTWLCYCNE